MSLTYGFFNSVDHDRVYDATQFGSIFNGVINDGVFQNIGDLFAVTPNEGMKIFVGTGRAWFNGTWTLNDSNIELTISESHPIYTRIDAVVLEVDHNSSVRANTIKIVEGTPASSPVRPTLIDDEFQHQHPLAYITVRANASIITTADIKNVVGLAEEGCPFVTGILEVNSVDYLYSQWQGQYEEWYSLNTTEWENEFETWYSTNITNWTNDFESWFSNLQDELDEHQAAHLQNEIDNLSTHFEETLQAGETSITFTSVMIKETSNLYLLIKDNQEVTPIDRIYNDHSITFIFDELDYDLDVMLKVENLL